MTDEHIHELRALLLAGLVALSVLAGGVAFAGTAVAEHHGLTASDGSGGNASTLIAGFDDQLPDGVASDDDTLRVEATNESFPTEFRGELHLPDSDITFADNQGPEDVELVVIGEYGDEQRASQTDGIEVTHVGPDRVAFNVTSDAVLSSPPVAVEIRNLRFDPGSDDTGSLRWTVNGETATHELRVEPFDPELTATDENGGFSAAVTAGAENQTMFGAATGTPSEPAQNLVLRGDEGDLPSQFEVTLSLDGAPIDFHDRNVGDITVTSSSGEAYIPSDGVSPTEIRVKVARFDGTSNDTAILELSGVTFDVPAKANTSDVTWEINGHSAGYGLLPDRIDARFADDYAVPRGLDGAPANGTTIEISSRNSYTQGLHDGDENLTVAIPPQHRDTLSFDTTTNTTATIESDGDLSPTEVPVTVEANRLLVSVDRDINDSEVVTVSNVRFNTSGFEGSTDADAADFESGLEVVTTPVDNGPFDPVQVTTSNGLAVGTPNVTVEGDATQLESGANSTTGSNALAVRIDDTTGHQIAPGSDVVVGLAGDGGIAFDTTQTLTVGGALSDAAEVSVSEGAIVVSVDENASATAAGDSILIESADGDGIRFDTSDAADGDAAAFSVETNAGDAPVVQSTGTVAAVGESPGGNDGNGSEDGSEDGDEGDGGEGPEDGNEAGSGDGSGPADGSGGGAGAGGGGGGSGAGTGDSADPGDGASGNETSAESANESSVEPPAGAVAFDAQQIADTAPGQEGVRVDFENVSVDSITFVAGADGQATIAQMDELPDDVPGTPGELLMAMEISVPENISDEQATIRFTLDESQLDAAGESPESIRLGHYTDGGWETSQPELVGSEGGEYVYESEVPGFSLYAVYAEESTEQTDSETTATATEDEPVGERAGLIDSPITAAFGFVGLLALVLTIAGARMYQQNDSL